MKARGYRYQYTVRRSGVIRWAVLAQIYADAAAWMEAHGASYDAEVAIGKATDHLSDRVALVARFAFRDAFGAWVGDDDGLVMLCFASALARTGDL